MSLSVHSLPHCSDVGTRWPCRQFPHLHNLHSRSLRAYLSTLAQDTKNKISVSIIVTSSSGLSFWPD